MPDTPVIDSQSRPPAAPPAGFAVDTFPLMAWIAENPHLLRPPTGGNTVIQRDNHMITVVGGPNRRTDWHVNPFEEFFFQVRGAMTLRVQRDGAPHDIRIGEGEIYLLPRGVPHAPQRPAETVGLIIERIRQPGELDAHEWYCERCNAKLFRKEVFLEVLERDMPPVFDAYYADPANQHCDACGHDNPGRPG